MPTSPMGTASFSLSLLIPIRRTRQSQRCSWSEPNFIEGDIFRIIVPLSEAATVTVGPTFPTTEVRDEVSGEVSAEVGGEVEIKMSSDKLQDLLNYCLAPRIRSEMQHFCGIKSEKYFREKILQPMITSGLIKRTIPDKPRSSKQKYVSALKTSGISGCLSVEKLSVG